MRSLVLLCFLVLLVPVHAYAERLEMHAIVYPPLVTEVDGRLGGVATEMIEAIKKTIDCDCFIHSTPWLRAYNQTKEGGMQALFAIVRIPERENFFKWVGPVFGEGDYFFKRSGSDIVVESLDDARKVGRIAVRKDGYTHQALASEGFDNLDLSPTYDSGYQKLAQGRVDLVLMGERTYAFMVKKAGLALEDFERTGFQFNHSSAWIAFSHSVPDEVVAKWQKGLDELKANGKYDEIMERNFKN